MAFSLKQIVREKKTTTRFGPYTRREGQIIDSLKKGKKYMKSGQPSLSFDHLTDI